MCIFGRMCRCCVSKNTLKNNKNKNKNVCSRFEPDTLQIQIMIQTTTIESKLWYMVGCWSSYMVGCWSSSSGADLRTKNCLGHHDVRLHPRLLRARDLHTKNCLGKKDTTTCAPIPNCCARSSCYSLEVLPTIFQGGCHLGRKEYTATHRWLCFLLWQQVGDREVEWYSFTLPSATSWRLIRNPLRWCEGFLIWRWQEKRPDRLRRFWT